MTSLSGTSKAVPKPQSTFISRLDFFLFSAVVCRPVQLLPSSDLFFPFSSLSSSSFAQHPHSPPPPYIRVMSHGGSLRPMNLVAGLLSLFVKARQLYISRVCCRRRHSEPPPEGRPCPSSFSLSTGRILSCFSRERNPRLSRTFITG